MVASPENSAVIVKTASQGISHALMMSGCTTSIYAIVIKVVAPALISWPILVEYWSNL